MKKQIPRALSITALLAIFSVIAPSSAEANRLKEYTEKYANPDHPAKPMVSSYLGGSGDEYLIGGAFQRDGTLYLAGNAFGPSFNLAAASVQVLGEDQPSPRFSMPTKKGKPNPPDSWEHRQGAGFIVELSSDYRQAKRAIRFPWGSGVVTDIVTDDEGHLYVAGTVGETFSSLAASEKKAQADNLKGDDEIFIGRLKPDLGGFTWIHRVQDDAGNTPQLRFIGNDTISMVGANGFHINTKGEIIKAVPIGITNTWQRGVSFKTFARVLGNFYRSQTGWEPWHRPFTYIQNPDGSMRFELHQFDSRTVGTNLSRKVSDSKLRMAAFDRNDQPVVAGWSDGGNSVWASVPYDFKKNVRSAIEETTGHKTGLPFSTWGAGVGSFLHLNRIDFETGNPLAYTLFISYLKTKNKPSSVSGDNLAFSVDNDLLLSGKSAYGLIQTRNTVVNTLDYDADYIGKEFFAILPEKWDGIRFSSVVPGGGKVALQRHSEKVKGHFRFDSAHVRGKTRVVAVSGAAQHEKFKEIQPVQEGFGGGSLDGLFVVLEMDSLDPLPEPTFKYPSAGARSIDLPDTDTEISGKFMVSPKMRNSDSILYLRDTTAKKWPCYYRGNPEGTNLITTDGSGTFILNGPPERVQLSDKDGDEARSRRLGGDGETEGYPNLKMEITLTDRTNARGVIHYQGQRLEKTGAYSIRNSSPTGKGINMSGYFSATKGELNLSESPRDINDEILIGWWAPARPAPKELLGGAADAQPTPPSVTKTSKKKSQTKTASSANETQGPRKWKNQEGQSTEASLEGVTAAGVELKLVSGQIAVVPLETLSETDQRHILKETKYRVWTSEDGQTLVARMTSAKNKAAEVVTPDGTPFKIPLERLSEEDQKFVRKSN